MLFVRQRQSLHSLSPFRFESRQMCIKVCTYIGIVTGDRSRCVTVALAFTDEPL
jgi:hypothetical protein